MLVVLYIPWISIFINQVSKVQKDYWVPMPSILTVIETFGCYSSYSIPLLSLFLILSILAIINVDRKEEQIQPNKFYSSFQNYLQELRFSKDHGIYLLLMWLLIPIILPFIVSIISTPIYLYRITIPASFAFYILIACGIEKIGSKPVKIVIILFIISFSLISAGQYYTNINKERWREVASYVVVYAREGDLLIYNKNKHSKGINNMGL